MVYMIPVTGGDQPLAVTGEEAVSEASDVDEPANAEGQYSNIFTHSMYCMVYSSVTK